MLPAPLDAARLTAARQEVEAATQATAAAEAAESRAVSGNQPVSADPNLH